MAVLDLPAGVRPAAVRDRRAVAIPVSAQTAALHKKRGTRPRTSATGLPVVRSRREQRRLELAAYTGASLARLRSDVPRGYLGETGCRAPDGMFAVAVLAWPPSKSNSYRTSSAGGFYTTREVHAFQHRMAEAVHLSLSQLARSAGTTGTTGTTGYDLDWAFVPGRVLPVACRPLYGVDVEVDVELELYEPFRTRRDCDGAWKVVLDVLTATGVFHDDVQVGNPVPRRPELVGLLPYDATIVRLRARPVASWASNPSGRPMNTNALDRAVRASDPARWKTLDEVLGLGAGPRDGPRGEADTL